jgi:hypothetical protein
MADLRLDILVVPTYNSKTLAIMDASTYPDSPPIQSPTIEITIPGFGIATLPFVPNEFNIFNSSNLGLTSPLDEPLPLPDGLYTLNYNITPAYENYVIKTIYRVEQLQEKFDQVFMQLDMMECDQPIKKQSKVELNSIYFLIQGAIAAANNCATDTANKLYIQASKQLSYLINKNCGCTGTNYLINF